MRPSLILKLTKLGRAEGVGSLFFRAFELHSGCHFFRQ